MNKIPEKKALWADELPRDIKVLIENAKIDALIENFKKTSKAIEPRTPISAIVIVGVNVIKKKTNITDNIASYNEISTLNT